jgi:tRNA(His) 5'-end guanylyltransferase
MKVDNFGDRMKLYEGFEANRTLMPLLPVVGRADGICFHRFCANLERPYDQRLSKLMIELTRYLVREFSADCGYTQSDEISLAWSQQEFEEEMFCGGRVLKLSTHLASKTSVKFNQLLKEHLPEKKEVGCFDARVFNVPNLTEAANTFLWREQDAARNSVQMAARAYFSHNQVMNKNNSELQEMLFGKNINWNDYPNFFKRGTFIVKRQIITPFTKEELETLPEKHAARQNPNLTIERNSYVDFTDLPKFSKIKNRVGFLFLGEEPQIEEST